MLFLVFQLGADRYAIEASKVIEVLPLINCKRVPRAPAGIAGIIDYHGASLPLIDLAEMALGQPSRRWMSTRILVVAYESDSNPHRLLGLIAEQATEAIHRNAENFTDSGLTVREAPYLGPVTVDSSGVIQRIEVANLLSDSIRGQLFPDQPVLTA